MVVWRGAGVPLRQDIDLQHPEALFPAALEVIGPVFQGDVGECAPDGIGKPEKGLAVPFQMAAVGGNSQLHGIIPPWWIK